MIDGLQPHMFMNIRILLVFFLLFLLKFDILDSTHQTKKGNKFWEPCFEEEENSAHGSSSDDKTCAKDDHFKLVRLPGMRVSETCFIIYIHWVLFDSSFVLSTFFVAIFCFHAP